MAATQPTITHVRTSGLTILMAPNFGRLPIRAAIATMTPSGSPTHHVATTPHPNAMSVWFFVGKIFA